MKQILIVLVLVASALSSEAWPRGSGSGRSSRGSSGKSWAGSYHADGMGTWHGGSNHNKGWGSAGRSNFGR